MYFKTEYIELCLSMIYIFLGYSKESQKVVQMYKQKDRYEPSPEAFSVSNAKYQ